MHAAIQYGLKGPALLNLAFEPSVELISVVRRFVANFFSGLVSDADLVSRVALAVHELLENAAKFSVEEKPTIRIEVELDAEEETVSVRTYNRAAPSQITVLTRALEDMLESPNPFDYYLVLMKRNAKRRIGSGLGLARIRAEAEMELRCELEDDSVCIQACTKIKGGK